MLRKTIGLTIAGLATPLLFATPAMAQVSWADGQMRFLVGSSAGGGFDTTARQIKPHLEERFGVNLAVENHPAGGGAVAGRMAVEDDSCRTILMWGIPHLPFSYMTQDVEFTYDDFAPLARVSVDSGVIRVHNDAPWATIGELIEDARERPGEITVAAGSYQDAYYLGTKQLEEATGVEFNIVPFGGGTHYAATVTDNIAVLVTLSAHEKFAHEYTRAVENLLDNLAIYTDTRRRPGGLAGVAERTAK